MTQEMDLKVLERKAWTAYFDDGILDITVGLFVIAFGIGMNTPYTTLTAVSWMVIFFFAAAKKAITLPRVGLVKFSPEREERIKKEKLFFVIFFTITALIGLGFFLVLVADIPQSFRTLVGELAVVSYQLFIVAGLCFVAYWKQIKRFYAYAALFLAAIVAGQFLNVSGGNPLTIAAYQYIFTGSIMLLAGFVILARFFRRYPKREGGEDVAR